MKAGAVMKTQSMILLLALGACGVKPPEVPGTASGTDQAVTAPAITSATTCDYNGIDGNSANFTIEYVLTTFSNNAQTASCNLTKGYNVTSIQCPVDKPFFISYTMPSRHYYNQGQNYTLITVAANYTIPNSVPNCSTKNY